MQFIETCYSDRLELEVGGLEVLLGVASMHGKVLLGVASMHRKVLLGVASMHGKDLLGVVLVLVVICGRGCRSFCIFICKIEMNENRKTFYLTL